MLLAFSFCYIQAFAGTTHRSLRRTRPFLERVHSPRIAEKTVSLSCAFLCWLSCILDKIYSLAGRCIDSLLHTDALGGNEFSVHASGDLCSRYLADCLSLCHRKDVQDSRTMGYRMRGKPYDLKRYNICVAHMKIDERIQISCLRKTSHTLSMSSPLSISSIYQSCLPSTRIDLEYPVIYPYFSRLGRVRRGGLGSCHPRSCNRGTLMECGA